jgi:hypothetical protein
MKWSLIKRCQVCASTFLDTIEPENQSPLDAVEYEVVKADRLNLRGDVHHCGTDALGILEVIGAVKT